MSRHCLVFFFFNSTIRLKAVSYTGSVFVLMLLDYELQTNIKHISTEIANSLLPVPQKLTVCSSLCRSCLLSVGRLCQKQITVCTHSQKMFILLSLRSEILISCFLNLGVAGVVWFPRCCKAVSCTVGCCHQGSAVHSTT